MRRIDKKKSIQRANLMVEQRYLQSKGLLNEFIVPLSDGKFAFAEEEGKLKSSVNGDIQDQINKEMVRLGLDPSQVSSVTINGKEVNIDNNEGIRKAAQTFGLVCALGSSLLSCKKENTTFGFNSNVHGVEYEIDNKNGTDEIEVVNFNGEIKKYKAVKQKDQQGNASGGVAVKEKPTEFEIAIFSFGKTLQEEVRSNRSSNDGETVVDYSIEKPIMNVGYTASPAQSIKDLNSFKDAMKFIKNGDSKHNVAEAKAIFNQEMKKAHAKGVFNEPKDVDYADYATSNY